MTKILAVASSGGHWMQLKRLAPAFAGATVIYVSTNAAHAAEHDARFYLVPDANLWRKTKLLYMFLRVALVILRVRPDVVISSGAAPGFAAIMFGKLCGARTVWLDSIANVDELSGAGQRVKRWADVWLTQWQHLARPGGPHFWGSVL